MVVKVPVLIPVVPIGQIFLTDGSLWLYQGHWVMTDEYRNYVEYVVSPAGHNRY